MLFFKGLNKSQVCITDGTITKICENSTAVINTVTPPSGGEAAEHTGTQPILKSGVQLNHI